MKSYREKFQTKLDEEISAFREGVLALSGQEIYDNAYKICFYEFMYNYLYSEKFTTAEYGLLRKKRIIAIVKKNLCMKNS